MGLIYISQLVDKLYPALKSMYSNIDSLNIPTDFDSKVVATWKFDNDQKVNKGSGSISQVGYSGISVYTSAQLLNYIQNVFTANGLLNKDLISAHGILYVCKVIEHFITRNSCILITTYYKKSCTVFKPVDTSFNYGLPKDISSSYSQTEINTYIQNFGSKLFEDIVKFPLQYTSSEHTTRTPTYDGPEKIKKITPIVDHIVV